MASAGTISVDVQARIQDFVQGLNKCTAQAEAFGRNLGAVTGKGESAFSALKTNVQGVTRDFKQITQGILLAQGFYTALRAIQDCTAAMWDYTNSINYAQTTFSNLFGDTELAKEFVSVLQEYAARSPFDFTDVEKAAMQLRAYGIESKNLMFVMQGIGNLASVTGDYSQTFERVARAIGQINAKGKLMGEEMRQLAEAGIDVGAVYDKLGTSADTLAKDNIKAADAINAVVDVMQDKYAGALDAANVTVEGMLANLKDLALMIASSILQPAYETFRNGLYTVSLAFNKFQETLMSANLADAIEQTFGSEVLSRITQFISIIQLLGNTLYSMIVPAFQLLGMYGQSLSAIMLALLTVITPVVQVFTGVLNAILSTAQGAQILQAVMFALASAFVATKIAAAGALIIEMVQGLLQGLTSVTAAASAAQAAFSSALAGSATMAGAAAAGFRAFTAALNVNPIIFAVSAIAALITALVGLKAVLGGATAGFTGLSNGKAGDFLKKIKTNSGDLSKFNQRLGGTNDQLKNLQDNLKKSGKAAKKAVEGLLSFDEVFKLNDTKDPVGGGGGLGNTDDLGNLGGVGGGGGLGDIDMPEIIDWDSLFPDPNAILGDWWQRLVDWFKNLNWPDIASAIGTGLVTGLRAGVKYFRSAWAKLFAKFFTQDQLDTVVKQLEETTGKLNFKQAFDSVITKIKEFPAKIKAAFSEFNFKDSFEALATKLKALPEHIKTTLSSFSFKGAIEGLGTKLKSMFTSLNFKSIVEGLKVGLKGAFLELGFDFVFDQIEEGLRSAGLSWAANGVENFGSPVAAALAAAIVTKNPFVAVASAVITSIFNSIDEGINTGDWSGTATNIMNGVAVTLSAATGTKAGMFAAIGSMVSSAIFGTISDSLEEEGNTEGAEVADKLGTVVSTAVSGAGIGAAFGPVGAGVGAAVGGILGIVLAFGDDIANWWNNEAWPWISGLGSTIMGAVSGAWATISGWLAGIPEAITGFFAGAGQWLMDTGSTIINGLGSGITFAWTAISNWFMNIGTTIGAFFGKAATWLLDKGKGIINGLKSGITTAWTAVTTWFTSLPTNIANFFSSAIDWLVNAGGNILDGLKNGITTAWTNVVAWFKERPTVVKNFFSAAIKWLVTAGKNILKGLKNGVTEMWKNVSTWFKERPTAVKDFFKNALKWLLDAGKNILKGLKNGITDFWSNIVNWFKERPTVIKDFFKNAINWLIDAGKNIIKGFLDGLKKGFEGVANWVGGLGKWFQEHKGPESYDKKLLVPAGNWIMGGLLEGLKTGFKGVKETVSMMGAEMQQAFGSPVLTAKVADVRIPQINANRYRATVPVHTTSASAVDNLVEEVANPFLDTESSVNTSSRPIMYVHNLIADKQGLRKLKRELDIIELENNRWR